MSDLISRTAAIDIAKDLLIQMEEYHQYNQAVNNYCAELANLPSAQPTLYGYPLEHLAMIARVLQKENLPPERVAEMLSDVGRIVEMVRDEFEEMLRKAVEGR